MALETSSHPTAIPKLVTIAAMASTRSGMPFAAASFLYGTNPIAR